MDWEKLEELGHKAIPYAIFAAAIIILTILWLERHYGGPLP